MPKRHRPDHLRLVPTATVAPTPPRPRTALDRMLAQMTPCDLLHDERGRPLPMDRAVGIACLILDRAREGLPAPQAALLTVGRPRPRKLTPPRRGAESKPKETT